MYYFVGHAFLFNNKPLKYKFNKIKLEDIHKLHHMRGQQCYQMEHMGEGCGFVAIKYKGGGRVWSRNGVT